MEFHSSGDWARGDEEFVVRIPCPSGAIRDLIMVTDYREATLYVDEMTAHSHFPAYVLLDDYETLSKAERAEVVATACCDFLEELFDDRVVVWSGTRPEGWLV